ncbi:MAG TPA: hypothetical protein VLA61_10675 [Ideonella sp.]|uniref:hypothetical protein n=1 Tax=Ideonella sp. TaxID=1929293 RepID=UPI002BE5FE6E|nr:hypothetical protein [Ideonella sp.]HSI48726.1 hypothetical protein [Ideonella sp.]
MTTATNVNTREFQASSKAARSGFLSLAAGVTFSLLAGLSQIANAQADDALMAQASQGNAVQVVVICGKRSAV